VHVPAPVGREDGRPLALELEGGDAVVGVVDAAAAGCSRRYLERHFRAKLGRSVHDEMLLARLDRVKELLETTRLSIGEVAAACGFARASHLARLFRQTVGVTMTSWRREHRDTPDE